MSKLLLQRDRGLIRGVPTVEYRVIAPELLTPKQLDFYKNSGSGYKIVASGDTLPTVGSVSSSVAQGFIQNQTAPVSQSFGESKTASIMPPASTGSVQSAPSTPQYSPSVAARLASGALTKEQADSTLKLKANLAANPLSAQNQMNLAASTGDIYGSATAKVPKTFDAGTLGKSGTPVALPSDQTDTSGSFAGSLTSGLQTADDIYKQRLDALNKQFEPIATEAKGITDKIKQIMGKQESSQTTYDKAFQKELNKMGDPEVQKKLADLNVQIAQRTADYNARIAALPGQGRGISTNIIAGQTDREKRMALVELGNLSTVKLAYQENIQAARDVALQTVNFLYKDEERSINNQLTLLQLNKDSFDRKEKQLADERTMILQDRQAAIEKEKSELLAVKNLAIDAAKNGAPVDVTQNMAKATSIEQALSFAGSYLQEAKSNGITFGKIGTKMDEFGNQVDQYGFINTNTQTTTSVNGQNESSPQLKPSANFSEWQNSLGTVTQDFDTPVSYFKDGRTTHGGYDIAGKLNAPVTSPVSGTVVSAGEEGGWGNSVVIQDAQGNNWRMAHFNNLSIEKGDTVQSGQLLGLMGNTGYVLAGDGHKPSAEELASGKGVHLHVEARNSDGQLVDPATINFPAPTVQLNPAQIRRNDDIEAYAAQYATTGQKPTGLPNNISFSDISKKAKELPKQEGVLVNTTTGVKDSKLSTTAQDDITRLYTITKLTDELLTLDKKRWGGVVPGALGFVFGSDAQSEYLTKRKAIVDEIQRMQSGAALSEQEQSFYADYLPGRFSESFGLGQDSEKKIQNFSSTMNEKLQNALKINDLSIYGYSTIKIGDTTYKVGDVISNGDKRGRVNADGSITIIE